MSITALAHLLEGFGSKLIETECTMEGLTETNMIIQEYLNASILEHIDADPDSLLGQLVETYGVGNYNDAQEDILEFQVLFN